jgi:hypothetical protein
MKYHKVPRIWDDTNLFIYDFLLWHPVALFDLLRFFITVLVQLLVNLKVLKHF